MSIERLVQRVRQCKGVERQSAVAELLEAVEQEGSEVAVEIFQALTKLCQEQQLPTEDLAPHHSTVQLIWKKLYTQAEPLQEDPYKVEWTLREGYQAIRTQLEWLLDLMAYVPGESISSALRESLHIADPLLSLFAAFSLLRRLEPIEESALESIAANPQTRHKLWRKLRELQMEFLVPQQWSSPGMLAESELVNWASYPTELGVPPEEIELMNTFYATVEGKDRDVYLFRFREYPKPWEPGEGWVAGIAGPYRDGQSLLSPFSSLDPWESMSPEEHFSKLFSIVRGER